MRRGLVIVIALALVLGCSKPAPSLVGTWTWDDSYGAVGHYRQISQFKPDGRFLNQFWDRDEVGLQEEGTYKLVGDQLTEVREKTAAPRVKQFTEGLHYSFQFTVRWLSPDRVKITDVPAGANYTMTRGDPAAKSN